MITIQDRQRFRHKMSQKKTYEKYGNIENRPRAY